MHELNLHCLLLCTLRAYSPRKWHKLSEIKIMFVLDVFFAVSIFIFLASSTRRQSTLNTRNKYTYIYFLPSKLELVTILSKATKPAFSYLKVFVMHVICSTVCGMCYRIPQDAGIDLKCLTFNIYKVYKCMFICLHLMFFTLYLIEVYVWS